MKKIKSLVLVLFIGLLSIVFLNDEVIGTFAKTYNNEVITVGKVYKSGDVINPAEFARIWNNVDEDPTSQLSYYYINYWAYTLEFYEFYDDETHDSNMYGSLTQYIQYRDNNDNSKIEILADEYENGNFDDPENHRGFYSVTLPQVDGKDVYWKVLYTHDDYSYYVKYIRFVQMEYVEPEAKVECDKEAIDVNQSTECTLSLDYKSKVSNFKFKLNASNFKVSDESGLNNWTIASSDDNTYDMTNDPTNITDNTLKKQKIFKFKLTAQNTEEAVNISDNIKLTSIAYTDEAYADQGLENLKTTLKINAAKKEETKKEEVKKEEVKVEEKKEEESNPPTFDGVIPYVIFLVMSVTAATVLIKKRKRI